jgi:hypothetical protein
MDIIHLLKQTDEEKLINFDSERHEKYQDNMNLFKNKPEEVFLNRIPDEGKTILYLALAIPREIPLLYSDLAFRNNLNAIIKNNDKANNAVDRLIYENRLDTQLSEASIDIAIKGGIVLKNYLDKGKSKIEVVQPEYYFPEFSKFDKQKIVRETIAFTYEENNETHLYREIYEERNGVYWCIVKKNRYTNGRILEEVEEPVETNTKLTESPLTYVPFFRANGEFWGYSIYDGLESWFDELNHRVSQIARILDKHSDPNMYADSSFFEEDEQANATSTDNKKQYNLPSGGAAYPVDHQAGEKPPGYVTYDSKLEANFNYIKDVLFEILYIVSIVKPSLYGLEKTTQISGRAIKLKSWRSECTVERSLLYWKQALKKVLYQAQQLEIIAGNEKYIPAISNIVIYIGLPSDELEQSQAENLKITSKLSSHKASIARLNPNMTWEEVEDEWLEILAEEAELINQTFVNQNPFQTNNEDD